MLAGVSPVVPNGKLFEIVNSANKSTSVTFQGSVTNNMGTKIDLGKVKRSQEFLLQLFSIDGLLVQVS